MSTPLSFFETLNHIREYSSRVLVIVGPSGSGKSTIISYLNDTYQIKNLPFVTTRPLRSGEAETGATSISAEEFHHLSFDNKIFLAARSYGNLYGYFFDDLLQVLHNNDSHVIVEAPAAYINTDVKVLLPQCTVLGIIP